MTETANPTPNPNPPSGPNAVDEALKELDKYTGPSRFHLSLAIGAVDGVRNYVIQSPDRAEVLAFLTQYDHEGSTVSFKIAATHGEHGDGWTTILDTINPEAAYRLLKS